MLTKDVFKNEELSSEIIRKNIASYLHNYVGFKIKPNKICYKKIYLDNIPLYIIILKDDIKRLNTNEGGSGVLRQKQWSTFIFTYIDKNVYESIFGKNRNKKNINTPYNMDDFNEFQYDGQNSIYSGKYPNRLFRSVRIEYLLQNYLFSKIYSNYRYLFLNSYVYSIIEVFKKDDIFDDQRYAFTYYYNASCKFERVSSKPIIKQKSNINVTSFLVESINEELDYIKTNYTDMIDIIRAYQGKLPLNPITARNYDEIISDIDNGVKFSITKGMARTGKTIIAMRILGKYKNANLIIMNQHFYKSLRDAFEVENIIFPEDRIINHTKKSEFARMLSSSSLLIVDEAQRLSIDEVKNIVDNTNANRVNILLGDNLQQINRKYDRGIEYIKNTLKYHSMSYNMHLFDHTIGIPNNILYAIKYLVYNEMIYHDQTINNYEVNIFNNSSDFINKYNNDYTFKKHMTTIYLGIKDYSVTLNGFERMEYNKISTYSYFLNKTFKEKYMLTTYEMISRELDNIYIYLPNEIYADNNGIHHKASKIEPELDYYLKNQIYVLMTRAKGSINIYCENDSLHRYLTERYKKIKRKNESNNYIITKEIETVERIKQAINSNGITRLIYVTRKCNLEQIYNKGIICNLIKTNDCINSTGIPLFVQNPNGQYVNRIIDNSNDFVYLFIEPTILYEITNEKGDALVPRTYLYNNSKICVDDNNEKLDQYFRNISKKRCWGNSCELSSDNSHFDLFFEANIHPRYIIDYENVE